MVGVTLKRASEDTVGKRLSFTDTATECRLEKKRHDAINW